MARKPMQDTNNPGRAVVVTSVFSEGQTVEKLGREAYSYRFAFRAFAPLLARWGRVQEVTQPESRLDHALWQLRRQNLQPIHFSFLPLHMMYLAQQAPNLAAPAWEFPDLPDGNFDNNPRNNWACIANRLALIVTHSHFTRQAFVNAGVKTPIHVLPVPITADYFALSDWEPGRRAILQCPAYVFPQPETTEAAPDPWTPEKRSGLSFAALARRVYRGYLKRRLPGRVNKCLTLVADALAAARHWRAHESRVAYPASPALELSGVVYTTIFNPFDPRKNWQDLLTSYLLGLRDCADATLVIKLVVCPELTALGFNTVVAYYRSLGVRHRCKVAFITDYLTDAQMVELARASTYYLNTSHAEGSCLPMQNFMAAGRPGVAPAHTGMAEYIRPDTAFPVASHPEPASWPHDPQRQLTTTWHRLVWSSLHEQLRVSYEVARSNRGRYQMLARNGRALMSDFASMDRVGADLEVALNAVLQKSEPAAELRKAS
jgi:glycosyltransferase involved in cell wall biosynthesis